MMVGRKRQLEVDQPSDVGDEAKIISELKEKTNMKLEELVHIVDNDDADTSDEEDLRNTVGNIPMEWYEDFPHIGYDLDGKAILKPIRNQDELDKFLDKMENPNYWRTIYDEKTGRDHILTKEEIELVTRLKSGKFYDSSYDPYEPYIDFFTHEKMIHPVNNIPEHKRSFTPSLIEKRKVGKLVHAIKMGWLKPRKPKVHIQDQEPQFYDLWAETKDSPKTHSELARQRMHISAPKVALPGHEASYNPGLEYLPSEQEIKRWEGLDKYGPRDLDFIPKKYGCLRKVPQYANFIQDRFSRCLDLYLCPRQRRMKVNVDPEDLIPKLPKPSDLRPFPTVEALCYKGHKAMVRTISIDVSGQWLASGSDDGVVRVWEVSTARCIREMTIISKNSPIKCVAWCPNASVCLLAVVASKSIVLVNPMVGDRLIYQATDQFIETLNPQPDEEADDDDDEEEKKVKTNAIVPPWEVLSSGEKHRDGQRVIISHPKHVSKVAWHPKGDYFASTLPLNGHAQVILHQLIKCRSQNPFSKCKGAVQCVTFHPTMPFLFVATQQHVKVYNLMKQEMSKKLQANAQWISSISIHPSGDNLIIGSYDSRVCWFDMDLSTKAYQTLRYHKKGVRACSFHRKYPLFASAGDDGSIIISHGMVYSDLLQNPLIVPVKVLKAHPVPGNIGITDCCFHPHQPWVFSCAADKTIKLFT